MARETLILCSTDESLPPWIQPFFLPVAKRHCLTDKHSPEKIPNTTAVWCFAQPHVSCFLISQALTFFTAQTPVSCKLTLSRATPVHSPSSMNEITQIPQEQTLTRDQTQTSPGELKGQVLSALKTTSLRSISGGFQSALN